MIFFVAWHVPGEQNPRATPTDDPHPIKLQSLLIHKHCLPVRIHDKFLPGRRRRQTLFEKRGRFQLGEVTWIGGFVKAPSRQGLVDLFQGGLWPAAGVGRRIRTGTAGDENKAGAEN